MTSVVLKDSFLSSTEFLLFFVAPSFVSVDHTSFFLLAHCNQPDVPCPTWGPSLTSNHSRLPNLLPVCVFPVFPPSDSLSPVSGLFLKQFFTTLFPGPFATTTSAIPLFYILPFAPDGPGV